MCNVWEDFKTPLLGWCRKFLISVLPLRRAKFTVAMFCCLTALLGVAGDAATDEAPIIRTDTGPVRGVRQADGTSHFLGIPYAAPPTGMLRWRLPQRHEPWTSPRDATQRGPPCYQADVLSGIGSGSEDCLTLTVYQPSACSSPANPCAVIFWVHGGAWIIGDDIGRHGGYNGSKLALEHSVVVVSVNYRLDVVGWLSLRELGEETSDGTFGNYGLHDQRSALQWVQRNVAAFGGDRDRVMLFGQSAGGFSVCEHLVSPASDRLFSHALVMSGSCSGPFLIQRGADAADFGDAYATAVGCPPAATPSERTACLRAKSIEDVTLPWVEFICSQSNRSRDDPFCGNNQTSRRLIGRAPPLGALGLTPVVDGSARGLPATPLALLQEGKINRAPSGAPLTVVMGTVKDEWAMFVAMQPLIYPGTKIPTVASDVSRVAQRLASYHAGWNASTATAIEKEYNDERFQTSASRLTRLGTDVIFRCPTRAAARALSNHGVSTYVYAFEFHPAPFHDPDSPRCQLLAEVTCGVHHAIDVPYVFGSPDDQSNASLAVSATLGALWTTFAKTGSPTGRNNTADQASTSPPWPTFTGAGGKTEKLMHISPQGSFQAIDAQEWHQKCDFWDALPPNPF